MEQKHAWTLFPFPSFFNLGPRHFLYSVLIYICIKLKVILFVKMCVLIFPYWQPGSMPCLILFKILDAGYYEKRFKDYLLCQHITRTETAPGSFLVLVLKKSMVQDAKTSRRIEKSLGAIFKDTIVQAGRVDQIGTLLPKYPMVISLFGFLSNEIWVVIIREAKQKGKQEEEMKKKAKEGRWRECRKGVTESL